MGKLSSFWHGAVIFHLATRQRPPPPPPPSLHPSPSSSPSPAPFEATVVSTAARAQKPKRQRVPHATAKVTRSTRESMEDGGEKTARIGVGAARLCTASDNRLRSVAFIKNFV
ncbi:hypothetical protein ACLKA7_002626 [Drosophila subpalustris]